MGKEVVDSAYTVHRELGPGLREYIHETCFAHELRLRGIEVETQVSRRLVYKDLCLDGAVRLDLLVGGKLVVEAKSVEQTLPVHRAQILSYLKLTGLRLGYLINFNVPAIRDGIERFIR